MIYFDVAFSHRMRDQPRGGGRACRHPKKGRRNTMKRVLAIILALLFVLTTFAACTSGSGSSSSAAEPSKSESSKAESSTSASSESEPEPDEPTVEPWDVPVFFQKDPEDMLWMHDTSPSPSSSTTTSRTTMRTGRGTIPASASTSPSAPASGSNTPSHPTLKAPA